MPFDRRNPVNERGQIRLSELQAIADQSAPAIQYPVLGSIYQSPTGQIFQSGTSDVDKAIVKVTDLELDGDYYPAVLQSWDGSDWADGAECWFLPANDEVPEVDRRYQALAVSTDADSGLTVYAHDFARDNAMVEVTSLTKEGGATDNLYYPARINEWDGESWQDGDEVYLLEANAETPVVGERYHSMFAMIDEDSGLEVWTTNVPAAGAASTFSGDILFKSAATFTANGSNNTVSWTSSAGLSSGYFDIATPTKMLIAEAGIYKIDFGLRFAPATSGLSRTYVAVLSILDTSGTVISSFARTYFGELESIVLSYTTNLGVGFLTFRFRVTSSNPTDIVNYGESAGSVILFGRMAYAAVTKLG